MPVLPALILMGAFQAEIKTPTEFEKALKKVADVPMRPALIRYLASKGYDKGIQPQIEERKVVLGIRVPGANEVEMKLVPNGPSRMMTSIGDGVFGDVIECQYGDAYAVEYYVNGKKVGDYRNFEVYDYPAEMKANPSVAKGEVREMPKQTSKIYPDTQSEWWVYKSAKPEPEGGYALIVFQDGQWAKNYAVPCLDNMVAKGDIPPCVALFIKPSENISTKQSIRMRQYDYLTDEYVRFVLEEYEPVAASTLGLKISQDPMKRSIAGLSSGGICAFTAAWERPEKFGLVMSWIGSFTNIASRESKREGGHNYPALIRKTDAKPIRVFLQDGDQDLDNEHGNWFLSNQQMMMSLKFKKYDYMWVPGHGYHSDAQGRSVMPNALRFLFGTSKATQ